MNVNSISENLDHPEKLEQLYQEDKKGFKQLFLSIYPEITDKKLADFWKIRLEFGSPKTAPFKINFFDIVVLLVTCLIAGFLIEIPKLFSIDEANFFFYEKNAALIVLLGLSLFSIFVKRGINKQHLLISIFAFLIPAIYINLLPSIRESHSITLSYLHLPLLMWCIYGLITINFDIKDKTKRIDFIKYNGDLAILTGLILIAGMILTAVTLGLFTAIEIKIERFYMDYIALVGVVSAPVVAAYIIRNYPMITNRIAPIIATIFSPLVLITLIIYLISIPIAGKDPFNDRDFLLIFNLMLIGVMAIIVFSISETSLNRKQKINELILLLLVVVTLLIDLVALSAILYRLGEFGFTPNRTAVLGSNLLFFGNLILILIDLYKVNFKNAEINQVENTISKYLPIYAFWTLIVVFGFPLIFGML